MLPLLPWESAQTKWKSQLDPILANPLSGLIILPNVSLANGLTKINHGLGRLQQGWVVLDIQGAAQIYRSSPLNSTTLSLTSSAAVTATIGVF